MDSGSCLAALVEQLDIYVNWLPAQRTLLAHPRSVV